MRLNKLKTKALAAARAALKDSYPFYDCSSHSRVGRTLKKWSERSGQGVLIGRLALAYFVTTMPVTRIELLFPSEDRIPENVRGFARTGERCFQSKKTKIDITIFTPALLGISADLANKIDETADVYLVQKIANAQALSVLLLQNHSLQGRADSVALINDAYISDLAAWPLDEIEKKEFQALLEQAEAENRKNI